MARRLTAAARRAVTAILIVGAFVGASCPGLAHAYCRTTTCDNTNRPDDLVCDWDASGCATLGAPLEWKRSCVSFSVEAAGSPFRDISYEQALDTISNAMSLWSAADCGHGSPAIGVVPEAAYECGEIGFSRTGGNSNAWVFRDENWAVDTDHGPEVIALTTVTSGSRSGEIFDVDIEVNTEFYSMTERDGSLFAAVALHESGHFFGLADLYSAADRDKTMYFAYTPSLAFSEGLSPDEVAGICDIYPPETGSSRCDPTPHGGFSAGCPREVRTTGCSCSLPTPSHDRRVLLALATISLVLAARRRIRGSTG